MIDEDMMGHPKGLTNKEYLGDAVYIGVPYSGAVVLYTSNGISYSNELHFDAGMIEALNRYVEKLKQQRREADAPTS